MLITGTEVYQPKIGDVFEMLEDSYDLFRGENVEVLSVDGRQIMVKLRTKFSPKPIHYWAIIPELHKISMK